MDSEELIPLLLHWFEKNARDLPWRRTGDPYAIWVSEIMLQQTQVRTVIPYWERWIKALPNVRSLARAKPQRLHKLWEGLGYYTRVRNMQKAARVLVKKYGGRFPRQFAQLLALPGIGRYTAGALCSIAFGQPTPAVDGNVIRVLTRIFGIEGDPRDKRVNSTLWELAERLVHQAAAPAARDRNTAPTAQVPAASFNQALMELGALICLPRQPHCSACPLAQLCLAAQQNRVNQLPALRPRPRPTQRRFIALIVRKGRRLLARQRPAGVVNGQLWEFPNVEVSSKKPNFKRGLDRELGITLTSLEPFCTIRHSITRYRITLDAFLAQGDQLADDIPNCQWLRQEALLGLPFTSAHRKILMRLTAR